jgi:GNAT superfamily N-acetyltransferase
MRYTWINEPPIVEVTENIEVIVDYVGRAWRLWGDDVDLNDLNRVDPHLARNVPVRSFVYMLAGRPVGLLQFQEVEDIRSSHCALRLSCLATHPGSKGGGSILIEYAVNLAEERGFQGRLHLAPEEAWQANLEAKGFSDEEFILHVLTPSESDKWVRVGDEWRLKKHRARSPLDMHTWRELTVGPQLGGRIPRRNFGFLS